MDEKLQAIQQRARQDPAFLQTLMTNPQALFKEYDLTEEQQLKIILPNFSWIMNGKLKMVAGFARPRTEEAFEILKAQGISGILTLTEQPLTAEMYQKHGFEVEHLPIADFTAPTLPQVEQAMATINRFVENGQKVGVHCAAGLGRTGTILACYLVSQGFSAQEAIHQIRTSRPGSIETSEQEAVIALYESHRNKK